MKYRWMIATLAMMLMVPAAKGTDEPAAAGDTGKEVTTVITSDKLTFDYKKHFALFEERHSAFLLRGFLPRCHRSTQ